METQNKFSRHTYSYLALRKAVGWIGLLLPFVLALGVLVFGGKGMESSISHYYYSSMGNVFVGALCAVALFMFFYSGYDKWDDWAGNLAGLFALGVALFPTTEYGDLDTAGTIHLVSAATFFVILALFSLFLFTKTKQGVEPRPQKRKRNRIFIICGIVMLATLLAIVINFVWFDEKHPNSSFLFWAETTALIAFGVSWLTKGKALYPDK